jgi:hypothetical protein
MAQLSRPYQIALVALAVLALVWFVALRHPGGESSSSSAPRAPSAASSSSSSGGSSAAGTSSVYHGSAPGVEGLTKDIAKAHQAVTESQRNAQELQRKSAQASGEAATGGAGSNAAAGTAVHRSSSSPSSSATATRAGNSAHRLATGAGTNAEAAPRAAALEGELTRGKVGVVLFWNPQASDDRHVHEQLESLSRSNRRIALQVARSNEATAFGQFTRTVQVMGTPTVLIVNHRGQVTMVTGLTDTFSVQQAIGDATQGAGRVQAPRFTSWTPTSSRKRFIDEANHVCRQATGPSRRELESLGSVQARIAALANAVAVIYGRVEALHMPAQDRPFIHHQFSVLLTALRRESRPLNAMQFRQDFLEGEAAGDEVYNGLRAYGLYRCI